MKKLITSVALIFACIISSQAQSIDGSVPGIHKNPNAPLSDRLFFGGIVGLWFGSQEGYVEVAPMIGYKVSQRFSAGLKIKYIYYKVKPDYYPSYSSHIYGGGPFARYFILDGLFAHFEYEILNMDVTDQLYTKTYRTNVTSVFVGGGYRQMMGSRSALDLMILYNINESVYSPYPNPMIQFGFAFGI